MHAPLRSNGHRPGEILSWPSSIPQVPPDSDLARLIQAITAMRFSGEIVKLNGQYGFIRSSIAGINIYFCKKSTRNIRWDSLKVGDRVRFSLRASRNMPEKLYAHSVSRDRLPAEQITAGVSPAAGG